MDAATYDDARWVDELGAVAALPARERPTPYAPLARDAFDLAARLSRRRADIQQQLGALLGGQGGRTDAATDMVDEADDHQQRRSAAQLANILFVELQQAEQALHRLVSGDYGICEECGEAIPRRRLERLPAATRCVACQAHHEARGDA